MKTNGSKNDEEGKRGRRRSDAVDEETYMSFAVDSANWELPGKSGAEIIEIPKEPVVARQSKE